MRLLATMVLVLIFGLTVALSGAAAPVPKTDAADWKTAIKDRAFDFDRAREAWSNDVTAATKAGLEFEPPTDTDIIRPGKFTFTSKVGPKFTVTAHAQTPFVARGDALCIADFGQISSGCQIAAYDLTTGKQAWKKALVGLGPIGHSKYRNRVTMSVERHPNTKDAFALVITGWESAGGYIEVIDLGTGKQLAHKKFSVDEMSK